VLSSLGSNLGCLSVATQLMVCVPLPNPIILDFLTSLRLRVSGPFESRQARPLYPLPNNTQPLVSLHPDSAALPVYQLVFYSHF
jgi:hypothetical protein